MHNGRTGFVYDALGNLIEKGSDYNYDSANNRTTVNPTTADYRRYTYDLFGRMTQVRALGSDNTVVLLAEYVYDFRGMRIAKRKGTQITRCDLDEAGRNLEIQEAQGSRTTAWIGRKPLAVQNSGGTFWYITDHQGTTAMMTDENGRILWEDAANPFGIPAGSRGTMQSGVLFTGKIFDPDADMYYFNARWYNPETGRFASEDPARDGINWYAYVGNNPLKYTDPTGLKKKGGFWDKVKSGLKKIGDAFRNNRGGGDSSGATPSTSSSSGSDSSDTSDSDDNSSAGANEEPPDGIITARDNGRVFPPNHGSEDSEKAFDASAVGDVKDDSKFLSPLIDSPDPAADNPTQVGKQGRASYPTAGLPDIGPCTYRACLAIAETRTGHNLSPDQIVQGVKELREAGTLSEWYVNSPVDVIDYGLSTLGSKEKSEWISRSTDFDQNPVVPEGSQASLVKTRENIHGYQHFGEGDSQGNVIWDGYGSDTIETVHRVDFFKFIQKE